MRVGIIGAGAAGLAAAYELGLAGHTAEVFEGAPFLGGQASTFDVNGTPLERGYHHLFRSDTAMTDLIGELGLAHRLRWIDSNVGRDFHSSSIHCSQEERSSTRWLSRSMMGVRPTGMYFPYGCHF